MLTVLACLLGIAATIVCLRAYRNVRGTTLTAPCAWAAGSLAMVTGSVAASALADSHPRPNWVAHVDYLAGVTTLAPFVALLGAKRPQDRAWQLIVAALVGLFAFQGFRAWSIDPAMSPTPHDAWRWLTTGLIVVQLLNYLATRHAASACLALAGQICLLRGNLVVPNDSADLMPYGLMLAASAVLVAGLRERRRPDPETDTRAWLEFRDRYGALWSLRVAERVNAVASQQGSPFRLRWSGFRMQAIAGEQPTDHATSVDADSVHKTLHAILARFVRGRQGHSSAA